MRYDQATGNERFSTLQQFSLDVGRITGSEYKALLRSYSYWSGDLLDSLQHPDKQEYITTVKFPLRAIGIRDYVSGMDRWNTITHAAQKEGIALCPQLTAPEMARLNANIIGEGEYVDVLSEPILDRYGDQSVFALYRYGGKLRLSGYWMDYVWFPDNLVVGRLR